MASSIHDKSDDGGEFARAYAALRKEAHRQLQGEGRRDLLQTTDVVHQVFLSLLEHDGGKNTPRSLAYAATAMRRWLVSQARKRDTIKRGQGKRSGALSQDFAGPSASLSSDDYLAVHDSLNALLRFDRDLGLAVKAHFLCGLTIPQTALLLSTTPRTAKARCAAGIAWLKRRLAAPET